MLAPGAQPNIRFPTGFGDQRKQQPSDQTFFTQTNAPDWTVIAGPQGPQWVYKGWHMVFTRRDGSARSTALDGAENRTWNTLKFVPPVPKLVAPENVKPAFVDGRYVLVSDEGQALFTGNCKESCASWHPFPAGMASAPVGQWVVKNDGDRPQWTYRGMPVFVTGDDQRGEVPAAARPLQP
jgi:predicted lipoprotein with Yx(FWY)xxD motif